MAHIFISYSKKNITFARHLRRLLENEHLPIWMDETKLVPSERWWPTIERNIRTCSAFIVIMSPEAQESEWVEREILVAEKKPDRKPIFPVLLAGETWSRLGDIQYEDMTAGTKDVLTPDFVEALREVVVKDNKEAVPPPPLNADQKKQALKIFAAIISATFTLSILAILGVVWSAFNQSQKSASTPTQAAVQLSTTNTEKAGSVSTTATSMVASQTPSSTLTPTVTLDIVEVVKTLDTEGTAAAQATAIAATKQFVAGQTATATLWTATPTPSNTPTPNMTASLNTFLTSRAASTATAISLIVSLTPQSTAAIKSDRIIGVVKINEGASLQLRRKPGASEESISLIPAGAQVVVFFQKETPPLGVVGEPKSSIWLWVSYLGENGNITGWVNSQFITLSQNDKPLDVQNVPTTADDLIGSIDKSIIESTATPNNNAIATIDKLSDGTNLKMREYSDSSSRTLTLLPAGTQLSVLGRDNSGQWLQVKYQDLTGWITVQFVSVTQGGQALDVMTLPVIGAK